MGFRVDFLLRTYFSINDANPQQYDIYAEYSTTAQKSVYPATSSGSSITQTPTTANTTSILLRFFLLSVSMQFPIMKRLS